MTRFFTLFTFVFAALFSPAQEVVLDTLAVLPDNLKEISGLQKTPLGNLWSLNDSGNKPQLFLITTQGEVKRVFNLANFENIDWEELATDDKGNLYIGDFGNNRNDRKDLRIYIVNEAELLAGQSVPVRFISFKYPDQKDFPAKKEHQNFDMEAMVWHANNLWLFSKNRTEPFTGNTNLYKLPSTPGTYVAQKVDSLFLGQGPRELLQITAADISPDGDLLTLLSYDKLILIHDFAYNDLLGGRIEELTIAEVSQRESVTFLNDSTLLIADERSVLGGGNLYSYNIAPHRKNNAQVRREEVTIPETQFKDTLYVEVKTQVRGRVYWEFFDGEGNRINTGIVGDFDRGEFAFNLIPKPFPNATYMLNIQVGKRPHAFFVYRFTGVDWTKVEKDFKDRAIEVQKARTTVPVK